VRQRNFFDPWGNPIDTTWQVDFPLTNRGFTGHEHYLYFKIINMNGRLYDPVIGRFFSPDKYVQIPDFTQSFNRYSYCLNNPLQYIDPSGESFLDVLFGILFFIPRVLNECFQWVDDKMNGVDRPNGYFNWSYLIGQTEPGAPHSTNSVNVISYGHPFYIYSTPSGRNGYGINADNSIAEQFDFEWYWAGGTIGHLKKKGSNKQFGMVKAWGQWYTRKVAVAGNETSVQAGKMSRSGDISDFFGHLDFGYNMIIDGIPNASNFAKGFGTGISGLSFFADMNQIYNQYNTGGRRNVNPVTATNAGANFTGLVSKFLSRLGIGRSVMPFVGNVAGFVGTAITTAQSWWTIYSKMDGLRFAPLSIDHTIGEPYFVDPFDYYYYKSIGEW